MKLQPKHIQPAVMATIMALIMTGFITWLNLGLIENFLWLWVRAYLIAWPLAVLSAFVAAPFAPRITQKILHVLYGPAKG